MGPKAEGTIPEIQRQALTDLGQWMATAKQYLVGSIPLAADVAARHDAPWVRWLDKGHEVVAFVDLSDEQSDAVLDLDAGQFALGGATLTGPGGKSRRRPLAVRQLFRAA